VLIRVDPAKKVGSLPVEGNPENMTRFRRLAVSIIKSKGVQNVAQKMRQLTRNTRLVFDYLRMTKNSCATRPASIA
jgi:hypothetical protein